MTQPTTTDELTRRSGSFLACGAMGAVGEMERSARWASGVRAQRILDTVRRGPSLARIEGGAVPQVGSGVLAQEALNGSLVVIPVVQHRAQAAWAPPLQPIAVLGRLKALGGLGLDPPCARRTVRG
jgi:hypothetical protein